MYTEVKENRCIAVFLKALFYAYVYLGLCCYFVGMHL